MFRICQPETVTLPLPDDNWITVKKRLNAGETREKFRLMLSKDGETFDRLRVGLAKVLVYLLDWSGPVPIRDQSPEAVEAALNGLEMDDWEAILHAVEAHDAAATASAEKEKNVPAGENRSSPISPSVESLAGVTNG